MTDPRKAAEEYARTIEERYRIAMNERIAHGYGMDSGLDTDDIEAVAKDSYLAGYAAAEQRWRSPEEEPCEGQLCVVEIFNRIITLFELRTYREHLGFGEIKTNVEFGRWLPITLPEGEA